MTAVAGSRCGSGATSTRPPPKRRRRLPVRPLPVCAEAPVRVDSAAVRTEEVVAVRRDAAGEAAAPPTGAMPQVSQ
jgi:hypothetical protein